MIAPTCQHKRKTSTGKDRKGQQRWTCKDCGVCFTEYHAKPLGEMQVNLDKAKLALRMLTEGMSIRATERTTGINRNTSGLGTTATITVTRLTGAGAGVDPAALDYVYMKDTYDAFPLGVDAFVPSSDPGVGGVPATLLGMTRTDDPTMKAGWRVTWQGSIEETIKFLCALMGQYVDNENTVCWVKRVK